MKKTFAALMAFSFLALPATAHEVWVERDAAGPARIYLGEPADPEAMLARIREAPGSDAGRKGGALAEWRRTGVGSQILADLGLGKLRVIGSPRKQVGLAGFGLEVVEYVELPSAG